MEQDYQVQEKFDGPSCLSPFRFVPLRSVLTPLHSAHTMGLFFAVDCVKMTLPGFVVSLLAGSCLPPAPRTLLRSVFVAVSRTPLTLGDSQRSTSCWCTR